MSRACSLMNERDNAMLNANIHEYYMDVTWMSMYVSNIHECYINEHVWPYQHIINVDMLSGSGTDAHIHEWVD